MGTPTPLADLFSILLRLMPIQRGSKGLIT